VCRAALDRKMVYTHRQQKDLLSIQDYWVISSASEPLPQAIAPEPRA
jgi:hypothetical protein